MRWLAGGAIESSFFGSSYELEDFSLAAYIADVACEVTGEGVGAEDILRVTLNALYALENKLKPRETVKAAFELFVASHSGFAPDLFGCRECGGHTSELYYLDVMNGNCICESCLAKTSRGSEMAQTDRYESKNILIPLSASALAAARYVLGAPIRRIFSFELKDEGDAADLSRFAETYLLNHLERGFDTLEFYHTVSKPL